ncbi:MAG: hypothetical protein ACRD82_22070, partial [Blastocatellia bacterium]
MFQPGFSMQSAPVWLTRRVSMFAVLLAVMVLAACSDGSVANNASGTQSNYRPPANLRGKLDNRVNEMNLAMLTGGSVK